MSSQCNSWCVSRDSHSLVKLLGVADDSCSSDINRYETGSSRLQLDMRNFSLGRRHLVNAYEAEAGIGVIAGNTV